LGADNSDRQARARLQQPTRRMHDKILDAIGALPERMIIF
jgi:hypothetical protein